MDDLVTRLRNWQGNIGLDPADLIEEAAEEIEELRAMLRVALAPRPLSTDDIKPVDPVLGRGWD
jgi:hypothetical protein